MDPPTVKTVNGGDPNANDGTVSGLSFIQLVSPTTSPSHKNKLPIDVAAEKRKAEGEHADVSLLDAPAARAGVQRKSQRGLLSSFNSRGRRDDDSYAPVREATALEAEIAPHALMKDPFLTACPMEESESPNPHDRANELSRATTWWINDLLRLGAKRPLVDSDVWPVPVTHSAEYATLAFLPHWERLRDAPRKAEVKKDKKSKLKKDEGGEENWEEEVNRGSRAGALRLMWAFILSVKPWALTSTWSFMYYMAAQLLTPFFVKALVQILARTEGANLWGITNGYVIAVLLVVLTATSATIICVGFILMTRMGLNIRNAAMDAVYRKALLLSSGAKHGSTTGEMVTLMSVDAERLFQGFLLCGWLWSSPIMAIIGMLLMIQYIGLAGVAGIAVMIFITVMQVYMAKYIGRTRERVVTHTQERVKLISECLQGIRVMKYSAWEEALSRRVEQARTEELRHMRILRYVEAINIVMLFLSPVVIIAATFLTFVALGNELTVVNVFTSIAYINVLRVPINILPHSASTMMEAYVSSKRLEKFLTLGELLPRTFRVKEGGEGARLPVGAVSVRNGTFYWVPPPTTVGEGFLAGEERPSALPPVSPVVSHDALAVAESPSAAHLVRHSLSVVPTEGERHGAEGEGKETVWVQPILSHVNLHINPGELCIVVGPVGAGKSSLLHALLGEMHEAHATRAMEGTKALAVGEGESKLKKIAGDAASKSACEMNGSVAYVGQEAWIRHASLRENILFESDFDKESYWKVIDASQLKPDLKILPAGDLTEIGERGINLSGGQKARVSLARALYRSHADIFILDDPMSAVDARVAKRIFEKAVCGLLDRKTRILVLNSHYHFLKRADQVVIVEEGRILASGKPSDLESRFPNYFEPPPDEDLDPEIGDEDVDMAKAVPTQVEQGRSRSTEQIHGGQSGVTFTTDATKKHRSFRMATADRSSGVGALAEEGADDGGPQGQLHEAEDRESGAVTFATYIAYFRAAGAHGVLLGVLITIGFVVSQVARTVGDWWLAVWSQQSFDISSLTYVWIYVGIGIFTAFITLLRSVVFIETAMKVSKNIHETMFHKILRAPITTFFDVTPLGRIINRFSKDMDQIDAYLPDYLLEFLQNALTVVGVVVVSCFGSFWVLIIFIPVFIGFFYVDRFFRRTSREVKRLESISRTPIFSSFAETLTGLTTIRAFGMEQAFLDANRAAVNSNTRHFFAYWLASRWLAYRLDMLSVLVTLVVAFFGVYYSKTGSPALAALALTYSMQLTGLLQWTVRNSIMVENSMTSTERILHYADLKSEAPMRIEETKPESPEWPEKGEIEFRDVWMRYRPELNMVLKGVSFFVRSREKIGICGRTGAGKSSIMMALFRIVELEGGSIFIDGVDISKLGLADLRSKLAIIPQDPVMFSGTVRDNLDPFQEYTDDDVWWALDRVHLGKEIRSLPLQLSALIAEGGDNLSVGQRQMICIARALLKKTRILVMDEATASVDTGTDNLIQQTIRENFEDRTVLCIAHRLETIIDSDRIAVIDSGRVAEIDEPATLLRNPESALTSLVRELGEEVLENMRRLAKKQMGNDSALP